MALILLVTVVWRRRKEGPWGRRRGSPSLTDNLQAIAVALLLAPTLGLTVVRILQHPGEWFNVIGSTALVEVLSLAYLLVGVGLAVALCRTPRPVADHPEGWIPSLRLIRHLGAGVFCGYLAIQLPTANWLEWVTVAAVLAPITYYGLLVRDPVRLGGLATVSPRRVVRERGPLLDLAVERLQLLGSRKVLEKWPARIAQGQGVAEDYRKAQAEIESLLDDSDRKLKSIGARLGLVLGLERRRPGATDEDVSESLDDSTVFRTTLSHRVADAVLYVGPSRSPARNAGLAVALGAG
jgi:hypothetical protein